MSSTPISSMLHPHSDRGRFFPGCGKLIRCTCNETDFTKHLYKCTAYYITLLSTTSSKRYGVVFTIRTDYQEIIVLPKLYGRRIFIVLILRNESVKALSAVFHDVLIGKNCQSIKKYEKIGDLNDPLSTYRVSVKLKSQNGSSPVKQD